MKRLGLSLLLALGLLAGGCSTTSRWENQLDQYRSGRLASDPDVDNRHSIDLRRAEGKRTADFGRTAGQDDARAMAEFLIFLLAIL